MHRAEHAVELNTRHIVLQSTREGHALAAQRQNAVKSTNFCFLSPDKVQSVDFITPAPFLRLGFGGVKLGNVEIGDTSLALDGLLARVPELFFYDELVNLAYKFSFLVIVHFIIY